MQRLAISSSSSSNVLRVHLPAAPFIRRQKLPQQASQKQQPLVLQQHQLPTLIITAAAALAAVLGVLLTWQGQEAAGGCCQTATLARQACRALESWLMHVGCASTLLSFFVNVPFPSTVLALDVYKATQMQFHTTADDRDPSLRHIYVLPTSGRYCMLCLLYCSCQMFLGALVLSSRLSSPLANLRSWRHQVLHPSCCSDTGA
jgi:hypothetical protein